jgi:hypothetical protein
MGSTTTVVVLVALGAAIALGGRTIATKTGLKSAYTHVVHSKPAHAVAKPFVWTAKRIAK